MWKLPFVNETVKDCEAERSQKNLHVTTREDLLSSFNEQSQNITFWFPGVSRRDEARQWQIAHL